MQKILLENKHFRNAKTLLLLRRRASPKQSPHCVNATTFLCVFLLFKLGEGEWSSIVTWPAWWQTSWIRAGTASCWVQIYQLCKHFSTCRLWSCLEWITNKWGVTFPCHLLFIRDYYVGGIHLRALEFGIFNQLHYNKIICGSTTWLMGYIFLWYFQRSPKILTKRLEGH